MKAEAYAFTSSGQVRQRLGRPVYKPRSLAGQRQLHPFRGLPSHKLDLIRPGLNVMEARYNSQVAFHNVNALGVTTVPDGQISTNSTGTGVEANLGVLLTPREGTRMGVNGLSQVNLKFSDMPHCTGVATGLGFTSGNILTASGLCRNQLSLGQKVPQQVMVSAYQAITEKLALVATWDGSSGPRTAR